MPDIFDEITGNTGKGDIFDQITSPTPATDTASRAAIGVNFISPTLSQEVGPPQTPALQQEPGGEAPGMTMLRELGQTPAAQAVSRLNELAKTPSPEWMRPAEKFLTSEIPGAKEAAAAAIEQSPLYAPAAIANLVAPESRVAKVGRAVEDVTAENLGGFATPANIALGLASGGLGEAAPIINRLIAAGFAIPQAKQTFKTFQEFAKETDPEKKFHLGIQLAESGALTVILGKGAVEGAGVSKLRNEVTPEDVAAAPVPEPGTTVPVDETRYQPPGPPGAGPEPQPTGPTGPIQSPPPTGVTGSRGQQIRVSTETQPIESAFAEPRVPINWAEVRGEQWMSKAMASVEPLTGKDPWGDAGFVLKELNKLQRTIPGIQPEQAAELANLKLAAANAPKAVANEAKIEYEDALKRIGGEIRATQERQQQVSNQPEYQGVPQGANLPADIEQVRETGRGQAGGGGGAGAGPEVAPQAPVITREQYKELRHRRAAGEVVLPEEHEQMRRYEQAGAQGRFGTAEPAAAPPAPAPPVANWADTLQREADTLQAQADNWRKNGMPVPIPVTRRIEAIKQELSRGPMPPEAPPPEDVGELGRTALQVAGKPAGFVPGAADIHIGAEGGVRSPEIEAENARILAQLEQEFPAESITEQWRKERAASEELAKARRRQPPETEFAKGKAVSPEDVAAARKIAASRGAVRPGEFKKKGYTAVEPKRPAAPPPEPGPRPPPTPEELRYGPKEPPQPTEPGRPAQPPPLPAQPPPLPSAAELAAQGDFGAGVWDSVQADRAVDPAISRATSQSFARNPRTADPKQWAHLTQHLIDLEKEQQRAVTDLNKNPGDILARDRVDQLTQDVIDQRDLMSRSRSGEAQGLGPVQALDAERMTLPRMEADTQAIANEGRPLSENPELAKKITEIHDQLQAVDKDIAAGQAHQMFEQVLKDSRKDARVSEAKLEPKKPFLQDAYDRAQARMQERFKQGDQFFSGIVPDPMLMLDQAIIGAYHIGRGVTKFADWSKAVAKDIGQKSQDYMEELFARSKQYHVEASKALKQPSQLTEGELKELKSLGRTEKAIGEIQKGKAPEARPPRLPVQDRFLLKQMAKKAQLISEFNAIQAKARWKEVPLWRRALVRASGVGQEVQTMKSAFDISAVLRQGGILVGAHPVLAGKALGAMAKAAQWGRRGETGAHEVMTEIENNPLNVEDNVIKRGKLELTNPFSDEFAGLKNTQKEEAFKGVLAKKIPGVNWSDRTFHIFLNKLRAESYYALINQLEKVTGRKATDHELGILANYVNIASGRGATGGFVKSFEGLAKIMWSPRLFMSRLQYLGLQPLLKGMPGGVAPVARALIAKEYASSMGGLSLALSLAAMAGATVQLDPRSKDFGKVRFGNTRIDLMAGLQQPFVLGSQLIMGKQRTQRGKLLPIRGKVPYGAPTGRELAARFALTKATPSIGIGLNLVSGQTTTGQPTTPLNEALTAFLPLSPSDIQDALQADGVSRQGAGVVLALMGAGVGTYQPTNQTQKDVYRATMERRDRALLHGNIPQAYHLTRKLQQGPF